MPTKKTEELAKNRPDNWGKIECYTEKNGGWYSIRIPGLIYMSSLTLEQLQAKLAEFQKTAETGGGTFTHKHKGKKL